MKNIFIEELILATNKNKNICLIVNDLGYGMIDTYAKKFPKNIGYDAMREEFKKDEQYLLVFGTGWGLERNIILNADFVLSPIEGPEEYNHLHVRAAIAIILDRMLGIRS